MPADHFTIVVPQPKFEGVITFLTTSLAHMGFKEHMRPVPTVVGLGEQHPYLWFVGLDPKDADEKTQEAILKHVHIAFTAESESNPSLL